MVYSVKLDAPRLPLLLSTWSIFWLYGGGPRGLYCHLLGLGWGYLSIPISHPHSHLYPQPQSQSLDNYLLLIFSLTVFTSTLARFLNWKFTWT